MKIVLAVDESTFSETAADAVRQWSWPAGTELHLLSVAEPPRGTSAEVWSAPALYLEEVLKAEREFRQNLVNKMSERVKGGSYSLKAMVLEGDARSAIVDYAERTGADLVVVGSHGRSGLSRLIIGSVAGYVVSHAPCSVFVVKRPKTKS